MYVSLTNAIGYIDLSKRRVSPEDIAKCDERYTKSKIIASIMRHVATRTAAPSTKNPVEGEEISEETVATVGSEDTRLQALYEQIAWPLAEKYGHTYEAFKVALT
jgi:translation initiation factor 2 subunit 1